MKSTNVKSHKVVAKRSLRVRKHLRGSEAKPRMCVVKSNKHISVQLIDDDMGRTLVAASTKEKKHAELGCVKKSKQAAQIVGTIVAQRAKEAGISSVVFDRGPFKYHGILAVLADAARQQGLEF